MVHRFRPRAQSTGSNRALNVLAELDTPGEFFIDRSTGRLFFWPPSNIADATITLSTLETPLIAMKDCSFVSIRGLRIEGGLGDGISVSDGRGCRIETCDLRNMRQIAIRVVGGEQHVVDGCDVHETGTGGIDVAGGDRRTLTPAGHRVTNNHIWRFSIHQFTSAYGLTLGGVGNYAAHNLIHDAPHQAVYIQGNDHVFELNEVHHICTETDDCGALYKGRNPSCRGNMIRFNYWHDIGNTMGHGSAAVYFDDGDGGDTVFGNVFYHCGDPGKGTFGTVFSHGGHDHHAENNIFIECKRALGSSPWNDARWRDALHGGQGCFFPDKLLKEVDITRPPYTTHYPELIGYMDPPAGAKRVNHARWNLLVNCGQAANGNWEFNAGENLVTDQDPGFVDARHQNFALRTGAEVFQRLPEFKPVPFVEMGLSRPATTRP